VPGNSHVSVNKQNKRGIVKVLKYRNLTAPFQKQRLNLKTFKKKNTKYIGEGVNLKY